MAYDDLSTAGRWILRDPNGVLRRYLSKQHALDASDGGDVFYFEQQDGSLTRVRRGVPSTVTQLR